MNLQTARPDPQAALKVDAGIGAFAFFQGNLSATPLERDIEISSAGRREQDDENGRFGPAPNHGCQRAQHGKSANAHQSVSSKSLVWLPRTKFTVKPDLVLSAYLAGILTYVFAAGVLPSGGGRNISTLSVLALPLPGYGLAVLRSGLSVSVSIVIVISPMGNSRPTYVPSVPIAAG